jgi:hypothetical protein
VSAKPVVAATTSAPSKSSKPSYLPSIFSYPSSTPTSQPTRDILPSVPVITAIAISAQSHNATVSVKLYARRDSPGAVYCQVLYSGTLPTSISSIMAGGSSSNFLSANRTVAIVLTNLLALKSYTAFCHVQTSGGIGSSYADILKIAKPFSTGCCQKISFSNSPVSVFGNVSLYGSSSAVTTYMFTYALDTPPARGSITVTPNFVQSNVTAAVTIKATPSSATFLSTDSLTKLTGYFFITASVATSQKFTISLALSGYGKNNYTASTASVTVMGSGMAPPAPKLISCIFDNTGGFLIATFDSPTDEAGVTTSTFACSALFTFRGSDSMSWCVLEDTRQYLCMNRFRDVTVP